MNKNIYFPIKFIRKKCKNGVICLKVLKADTFEVIEIYTDKLGEFVGKSGFVVGNLKYNTDNIMLSDNTKVVVYEDTEKGLYGVVTYSTHPQLWWVPKENIRNNDKGLDTLLNLNINETEDTYYKVNSSFSKSWISEEKTVFRVEELRCKQDFNITIDEFNKLLYNIRKITPDNKNSVASNDSNNENINNESLNIIIKDLVERELKIKELQEQLKLKEEELDIREQELIERDSNFLKKQAFTPDIRQLDIDEVANIDEFEEDTESVEKSTYELILKTMKKGNVISIPYNVYKLFKIIPKGSALDRNNDYTIFTQVATIKYSNADNRSILAMISVDNENPVEITILVEYGTNSYDNEVILKVSEDYRRMKRNRSYLV